MKNILFLIVLFLFFSNQLLSQHDADSLKNVLKVWVLENDFDEKEIEFNDTSVEMFHNFRNREKYSILTSNLGNIGSASMSDLFFKRFDKFNNEFSFNEPYFIFIKNPRNISYYNTRRPYTSIMHTTSTKINDIQTIDFTHTQNVHPNFNFGLNYDFTSSAGQFEVEGNQSTRINSVGLSSNYKKDKYSLYLSYAFNKFVLTNSGGYVDTVNAEEKYPKPKLSDSHTSLLNQDFSLTQKYKFGSYKNLSYKDTIIKVLEPKISISHNLTLQRKYRIYEDTESDFSYFPDFFYQEGLTYDSIGYKAIINKLSLASEEIFEKNNKFGFLLTAEAKYYQLFNFKRYFFLENSETFFENNIYGEIFSSELKNFFLKAYSKYYLTGYRSGDFRVGALVNRKILKKKPKSNIQLHAKYTKQKADYFQNQFYSNHYFWENDFDPAVRADLSLSLNIPENYINFRADAAFIKNYIYYDAVKRPVQFDLGLTVISVSASKDFRLKRLNFINKVIWQNSSDDNIISLPVMAAYHSTYFDLNYNNSLIVHLGFELYYSTKYKAHSFNPAVGHFYFENDPLQTTGNYPNFSVYANLKIKRNVFIFLKLENLNSGILTESFIFDINHYPIYGRIFKFGVRWTFKN